MPRKRRPGGRVRSHARQERSAKDLITRNVERVVGLEAAEQAKATRAERVADLISAFTGSTGFLWLTIAMIGGWIVLNLVLPTRDRVDPFPFPLLTLLLSVEAIFLSIFILMSQNRAAGISEKRSQLDLQLNLLAEQENTKMLAMLQQIGEAVGAKVSDPDLEVLAAETEPESLSRQIDRAVEEGRARSR